MNLHESNRRRFKQVDVFTDTPCKGNPLAVVLDAHGLSDSAMQALARWTNLSETTFILADSQADYRLRIFTLDRELPFAGHPTIGSAHAAIEAGIIDGTAPFRMRCGLGILPMRAEDGKIWVQVPPPRPVDVRIDKETLKAAINGATPIDPLTFDTGPVWMVARVESEEELVQVRIDGRRLADMSRESTPATGLVLYALNQENGIEVRAFAPAVGIEEDPVCGSGNLSAAAHLKETGQLAKISATYQARQGRHMGRDGILNLAVRGDCFELGGEAVTVIDGNISI